MQFQDGWQELIDWMAENEEFLDEDSNVGNDPDKIKQHLNKHKDFQRALGAKQPAFDAVNRLGRSLRDRCPRNDVPVIQDMMNQLKNRWNLLCSKSVDKQRTLEDALLCSGQFKDALQALLDWLYKVEPLLAEDQPVHGDLDTVNGLVEEHKVLLASRTKHHCLNCRIFYVFTS